MISKGEIIRRGAQALLIELDRDRAALLKLIGAEQDASTARERVRQRIVAQKPRKARKVRWTAARKARMSRLMKAKYATGWKKKT